MNEVDAWQEMLKGAEARRREIYAATTYVAPSSLEVAQEAQRQRNRLQEACSVVLAALMNYARLQTGARDPDNLGQDSCSS